MKSYWTDVVDLTYNYIYGKYIDLEVLKLQNLLSEHNTGKTRFIIPIPIKLQCLYLKNKQKQLSKI